jgi:hypothetical protein
MKKEWSIGGVEDWSIGVMGKKKTEYRKDEMMEKRNMICNCFDQYSNTPILHHSNLRISL